jgi:Family of unknown function (DUF6221)
MGDLVAFLNARLDEDEAAAKAAASVAGPDWHHDRFWPEDGSSATTMVFSAAGSPLADTLHRDDEEMAPFIARHDPARVLREVEADRAILAALEAARQNHPAYGDWVDPAEASAQGEAGGLLLAAKLRAAVYSDHPDYRDEWKP